MKEENEHLISQFIQALKEERKAQRDAHIHNRFQFLAACWQMTSSDHHVYQFKTEEAIREPPDSIVNLVLFKGEFKGILLASKGLISQIAFDHYLGESISHGELSFESGFLLKSLSKTLEKADQKTSSFDREFAEQFFNPISLSIPKKIKKVHRLNLKDNLVEKLAFTKRLFIWGPAGTGKTKALADCAFELIQKGASIFISANTHMAVNQAILRLLELMKENNSPFENILRFGLLQKDFEGMDLAKTSASPHDWLKRHYPDLYEKRLALFSENKMIMDQLHELHGQKKEDYKKVNRNQLMKLEGQLQEFNTKLKKGLKLLVKEAQVVGSTLAQVYLNEELWKRKFDYVMIDEASQANLPNLYLAAGMAKKGILVFGDFRQLPPICFGKTPLSKKWLGRDIFDVVGFEEWVKKSQESRMSLVSHPEVCLLNHQRRMHPDISRISNEIFYHGYILDDLAISPNTKTKEIPSVILYDTSKAHPWCTKRSKGEGKSRINLYHALCATELAERCLMKKNFSIKNSIGIITPYREQAKLIQQILEDRGMLDHVQVATVHQFQGEEREIIIWDTVDTQGLGIGQLLEGSLGSNASRMINVALTRAKQHLFILADVGYLKDHLRSDSSLKKVLEVIPQPGSSLVDSQKLLAPSKDFYQVFQNDLNSSKKSIIISSPLFFRKLDSQLEKHLEDLHRRGVKVLIDTLSSLHQRKILKKDFFGPPSFLGKPGLVTVCHDFSGWEKFIHPNLVLIDNRIGWFSSYNLFSKDKIETENGAFRFTGRQSISNLNLFFGLGLLKNAPMLCLKCPLCEGQMILMWNRRKYRNANDYYASCSEGCGYNRPLLREERKEKSQEWNFTEKNTVQNLLPGFVASKKDLPKASKDKIESTAKILDPCPRCGGETIFRINPNRYLFVGCSSWPNCTFTRSYQEPCLACKGTLTVRRSKNGIFLGCINYPRCRETKDIPKLDGSQIQNQLVNGKKNELHF